MKKLLFFSVLTLCACSQDDLFDTSLNTSEKHACISETESECLRSEDVLYLENDTTKIEYIKKANIIPAKGTKRVPHRAIVTRYDGTAQGTPTKTMSNQKVIIRGVAGVTSGVYFADIYTTSGTIELPAGVTDVNFVLPDVCGYCDWTTQEEGIIKSTIQTKKGGIKKNIIKWSFYTMVLNYNAAGTRLYKVIPKDGAQIYIPYEYVR